MKKSIRFAAPLCAALALGSVGQKMWVHASRAGAHSGAPSASIPSLPQPGALAQGALAADDAAGFRPSQFEGVSVRERPAKASASTSASRGGRGWIAIKPGAPRSALARLRQTGATQWKKQKNNGRWGGDMLVPSSPYSHASVGVRTSSGKTNLECMEPGESAHAHAHPAR